MQGQVANGFISTPDILFLNGVTTVGRSACIMKMDRVFFDQKKNRTSGRYQGFKAIWIESINVKFMVSYKRISTTLKFRKQAQTF